MEDDLLAREAAPARGGQNPCGFVLLPTYLVYFLGLELRHGSSDGTRYVSQRATVRRALLVSGAVSAGFMAIFLAVGLVSYHFTNWINQHAKYATVVIAVGLVAMGVAMLFGWKLPITTPRSPTRSRRSAARSRCSSQRCSPRAATASSVGRRTCSRTVPAWRCSSPRSR